MTKLKEFIGIIGRKRLVVLLVMLGIVAIMGGVWENILKPDFEKATLDLTVVQAERARFQKEITELPAKHAALVRNEKRYEELQLTGFFGSQDRIEARSKIDALRLEAGVRGITYKIDPQIVVDHAALSSSEDQLILSPITVSMKGLTDREMRFFLEKMQTKFPGLIVAKQYKFTRTSDVTQEELRRLSEKEATDFVSCEFLLSWYNIVPKANAQSVPLTQAFEGATP